VQRLSKSPEPDSRKGKGKGRVEGNEVERVGVEHENKAESDSGAWWALAGGEQVRYFKTSEPSEDECMSLDLAKLQRKPRDRRLRVFVRTLACVRVCMCVCARVSFSRVLSLFLTPFLSPLLSPFFSFSFSFSPFLSLSFLSLNVSMSQCLCVSVSPCL